MRFINIVDSVSNLNFGVWNAAIINAVTLKDFGVETELWYLGEEPASPLMIPTVRIADSSYRTLDSLILERKLNQKKDLIVTSGIWRYPSKWGAYLSAKGFQWILVPQGMLEPWPLTQKWLQKKIYFNLVEKNLASKANIIRAVSKPEAKNLSRIFPHSRIEFIPNGVEIRDTIEKKAPGKKLMTYLFLSRLHHKKNVISLVEAWISSSLNNNPDAELIIAGPDQGELVKVQATISGSQNARYVGVVHGSSKERLFEDATFYVLPSFSEGMPSSLLEAMSYGVIPIITEGCNLPDVGDLGIGKVVTTDVSSIRQALHDTAQWQQNMINEHSDKCKNLISKEYSIDAVTRKQISVYLSLSYEH